MIPGGGTGFETCTASCKAGVSGNGAGQLDAPGRVATDCRGAIYVADEGNHRKRDRASAASSTRGSSEDCRSPRKVKTKKLDPGKHSFSVVATDAAGNADLTPAKLKFKVERKKRQ